MTDAMMRRALETLVSGEDLDVATARGAMDTIMEGTATPAQMAAFLVGLRAKGASVDEVFGMVESMREHGTRVELDVAAVDTCGTGGDGTGTFNISTAAALVVAGAGFPVAKHGNRAASSRCGSADVLEALGVAISLPPAGVVACVESAGMGFLYAPAYHPAMRHVAPVRRELGITSIMNLLGPLANPAGVRRQVLGVADGDRAPLLAETLVRLDAEHAMVVHGKVGMDEISPQGVTDVWEIRDGRTTTWQLDPAAYGLAFADGGGMLRGGDAAANAARLERILAGNGADPAGRAAVVLNGGAAIYVAGLAASYAVGVRRADEAISSGAARAALERLRCANPSTSG